MSPIFHIRPATLAARDNERVLAYFDSQLQWLETIGSYGQWGSSTRSSEAATQEKYRAKIQRSEEFAAGEEHFFSADGTVNATANWTRAYVVEADVEEAEMTDELRQLVTVGTPGQEQDGKGRVKVPVAAMVLDSVSSDYIRSVLPAQDSSDPFIFLTYLLSDRRAGALSKGAGAVLISYAKEEARRLGVRRITADCWAGNERKLVRYYEAQGFTSIGDFGADQGWPGTVLEMRL